MTYISERQASIIKIIFLIIIAFVFSLHPLISEGFLTNNTFSSFSTEPFFDSMLIFIIMGISFVFIVGLTFKIDKTLMNLLIVGLLIRYVVVFAMSFYDIIPYAYDLNWDIHAFDLVQDWQNFNFHLNFDSSFNVRYYTIFTTIVYFVFQPNPLYMQLINVIFSVLSIYYVFRISMYFTNKKVARFVTIIMAFWPSFVLFTSMHMRDSIAIFAISGLIYYLIKNTDNHNFKWVILGALHAVLAILMRQQNAILVLVAYFLIIYLNRTKQYKLSIRFVWLLVVSSLFLILLYGMIHIGYLSFLSLDYITTEMNYRTSGGSAYLTWMEYGSLFDIVIYSPIRLIYFIFTPFFWQVQTFQQLLAFIESLILFFMVLYTFRYRKRMINNVKNKNLIVFLILFGLIGMTGLALIDSNTGTALRHKQQFLYVIFIIFGISYYSSNRSVNFSSEYY